MALEWLNYHHLLYFWTVAREGSIAKACQILKLSQPTISAQLKTLEDALGEQLFRREGRRLELTDTGMVVFGYAEEIFNLGRELMQTIRGRPTGRPLVLRVGISDVLPKQIAYQLLEPALESQKSLRLVCSEDRAETLISELATHQLDVVLSDQPVPPSVKVKGFNHLLGECGVTFFAADALAKRYKKNFPESLTGAPMLVPLESSAARRTFEHYCEERDIVPLIVGEFEDTALISMFAQSGAGIFFAPSVIEAQVVKNGLEVLGRVNEITERFYAISVERRVTHPAVAAICNSARANLFTPPA